MTALDEIRHLREIEERYEQDDYDDETLDSEWRSTYLSLVRDAQADAGHVDDEILGYIEEGKYTEAIHRLQDNLAGCPFE